MNRKKRSVIWKIPKSELQEIVDQSVTFTNILSYFNLSNKGGNCKTLKARLSSDNIDFSHIPQGLNSNRGLIRGGMKAIPLEEILVVGSTYHTGHLKERLIKGRLLEYKCNVCRLDSWRGKKLSLQLEHRNGISNDNRLENLTLLCPNCHSQTSTFAGKSNKLKRYCDTCGKEKKSKRSKECVDCHGKGKRKVDPRPSLDILKQQVSDVGYRATGRIYGVSDGAIRKWLGLKK
jgi:Zn finger protein HypA/HybF involved in hydrogenase expression